MLNWQRDPKWKDVKLGTSDTTIGDDGCAISVIGNIIGVDPTVINDRLNAVNGFAQGNEIIWDKIPEAFPGISINRVWAYNNDDVKANVPNVIVEVPAAPIGGSGSHWVEYLGGQQLADPWTGTIRPTSDFPDPTGYCTITGQWNTSTSATAPSEPTQETLDSLRTARDTNWNLYQGEITKNTDLTTQIQTLQDKASSLGGQVSQLEASNTKYQTDSISDQTEIQNLLTRYQDRVSQDKQAIEDGIKAQNDLKTELIARNELAVELNCQPDWQNITDAVKSLQGQLTLSKKATQDQLNGFNKYLKLFINIFIKKVG